MADTVKAAAPALDQEIVTLANDVTNQVSGFILNSRDEVLAKRGVGRGLEIYQDLERDAHVKGVLRKRMLAVIAREPQVTPASDEPQDVAAAELVKAAINGVPYDRYTKGMMRAVLNGFAVAEIIWGVRQVESKDWILPTALKVRNPSRFVFDKFGQPRLLTPERRFEGIPLEPRKFIVLRYGEEETEDPYGLGLGNALYWPVFFKRKGIQFWFKFCDKFGQPTVKGTYPRGAGPAEIKKLMEAMNAISQETSVAMPEGMDVQLLEAIRTTSINTYQQLCDFMDKQISEAVLGETLSTNIGDVGSMAASQTHNDVRQELTDADCELICDTDNETLAKWIVEINMPGAGVPTIWRDAPDSEDLKARAERDNFIVQMGFEPTEEYIRETYGGDWTKKAPAPAPPSLTGQYNFAEKPRDGVDDLVDQTETAAAAAQDRLIDRFKAALESSHSLEEFAEKVLKLEPEISTAALAQVMGEAMTVAELQGRADIVEA